MFDCRAFNYLILSLVVLLLATGAAHAQSLRLEPGWHGSLTTEAWHQFEVDVDNGGEINVDRFRLQSDPRYITKQGHGAALVVNYGYDHYDFSGSTGLAGLGPWDDVHSVSLGLPLRFKVTDQWAAFAVPTIRSSGEEGADFDDTITGGLVVGATYKVNERLLIGPGLLVMSQLEDDATVALIPIIDWRPTDKLRLRTGRGMGGFMGSAVSLSYEATQKWTLTAGAEYQRLRFRLDDDGVAPNGVGEDSSVSVFVEVARELAPFATGALFGGAALGGELELEDEHGDKLSEEDYDSAGFVGLSLKLTF